MSLFRVIGRALLPAMALAVLAGPARAQLGFNASVASDDRFRGQSLSDSRPTISLGAAYDHPSGLYAGVSATAQDTRYAGLEMLGVRENLGYAWRARGGLTVDVGADNQTLQAYSGSSRRALQYAEVYAGLGLGGLSGHLYYSPDYFRPGNSTLYAELTGSWRPSDPWRIYGALGALDYLTNGGGRAPLGQRYDARLGVARTLGRVELRLEGTLITPHVANQSPDGLAAAVSVFF